MVCSFSSLDFQLEDDPSFPTVYHFIIWYPQVFSVGSERKLYKIMNTTDVNKPSSRALPSENNIPQTVNSCVNELQL